MKKNLFCALLTAALLLALCACGGGGGAGSSSGSSRNSGTSASQDAGSSPSGSEAVQASGTVSTLSFTAPNGSTVSVDENMADVLNDLGEAQSYFEAPSCAFEGLDKTYTYSGFVITTRPDGDQDFVSSIRLTDDSLTTPEGVYIGSSQDDVTAAYGEGVQDEAELRYTQDGVALSFILEDGKVVSIEYLAA